MVKEILSFCCYDNNQNYGDNYYYQPTYPPTYCHILLPTTTYDYDTTTTTYYGYLLRLPTYLPTYYDYHYYYYVCDY